MLPRSLSFLILLACLFTFIAPSYQHGTMFADNITPAFEDETYIAGVRTDSGFSTSAAVGSIEADNVLGFFVSTPGSVSVTSDSFTVTSDQAVNLEGALVDILSQGNISITSQRADFDADEIAFSGAGDVHFNALHSNIRAEQMNLSTVGDLTLQSTGDSLDLSAPDGVNFASVHQAYFQIQNNIEMESTAGDIMFSGASFATSSNFIDVDGQFSFLANATDSFDISAGAIVEFASVGSSRSTIEDMNIEVSSGDIELNASGILSLQGAESASMVLTAERNTFIKSRSSAESIIRLHSSGKFTADSTEQLVFASFDQDSSITFSGIEDMSIAASTISATADDSTFHAHQSLTVTARNDLLFDVSAQDFVAAARGAASITSTSGSFHASSQDEITVDAKEIFVATTGALTLNGHDLSIRQNDVDADTHMRITSTTQLSVATENIEWDTSGALDWANDGDFLVSATDILIEGDKAVAAVSFQTEQSVTVDATGGNILYSSPHYSLASNSYTAVVDDSYDVYSSGFQSFSIGADAVLNSIDFTTNSDHKTLSLLSGASTSFDVDAFTHSSFTSEYHIGGAVELSAERTLLFDVGSYFSADIDGTYTLASTTSVDIQAESVAQFLQDSFELLSDDVVLASGIASYHSQNLPDDTFNLINAETVSIVGDVVSFVSGGNFDLETADLDISGDELLIEAFNSITFESSTFDVDANGIIDVSSGGGLLFTNSGAATFEAANDFIIDGPDGEHGVVFFESVTTAITLGDGEFLGSDFTVNTSAFASTYDTSLLISSFEDQSLFGEDITLDAAVRFTSASAASASVLSGTETTISASVGPVSFTGAKSDMYANNMGIISTLFSLQAGEQLTWHGDSLSISTLDTIQALEPVEFDIYSGGVINYISENDVSLSAPLIEFTSTDLFHIDGTTVSLSSDVLTLHSGGSMAISGATIFSDSSVKDTSIEAATVVADVGQIASWEVVEDIRLVAMDGVATFWAGQFGTFSAGSTVDYLAGGSIYLHTGSNTFSGSELDLSTSLPEGNIVFDTLSGSISSTATGSKELTSSFFADLKAYGAMSFLSNADLNASFAGDLEFLSAATTEGTVTNNFEWSAGGYGLFESHEDISMEALEEILFSSSTANILLSTGEQGPINFVSRASFNSDAGSDQRLKSSSLFDIIAVDSSDFMADQSISLFTTGGDISMESSNGEMSLIVGGDSTFISGDRFSMNTEFDSTWTITDSITMDALRGDISFFFEDNTSTDAFTAGNAMLFESKAARNPVDGVTMDFAGKASFIADGALTVAAVNFLNIGGITRPVVTLDAGGDLTQTGIAITSDGEIETHAVGSITYSAAAGQINSDSAGRTFLFSNDPVTVTATTVNVNADNGDVHIHSGDTFLASGTGDFSATSLSGTFEFEGTVDGDLSFTSAVNIAMNAVTFDADVFNVQASSISVDFAQSKQTSFSTVSGSEADIQFDALTDLSITSVGAQTFEGKGSDGSVTIQGETSITLETITSGDISLLSAGDMKMNGGLASFESGSALSFTATSNRGQDHTTGDLSFLSNGLLIDSSDTFTLAADGNTSILTDQSLTVSGRDVAFSSADDLITRFSTFSSNSESLIFETTPGNGGSLHFDAEGLGLLELDSGTVLWNPAGNVLGSVNGLLSLDGDSFALTTTAADADIVFHTPAEEDIPLLSASTSSMSFLVSDEITLDYNAGATGELFIDFGTSVSLVAGTMPFTAATGDIDLFSYQSTIEFNAEGEASISFQGVGDNAILNISAAGISPDSEAGIFISSDTNTLLAAPGGDITVTAWEAIILTASNGASPTGDIDLFIGHGPFDRDFRDAYVTDLELETNAITALVATGLRADIVLNTRDSQGGESSLSIFAGLTAEFNPFDPSALGLDASIPDAQVDFLAAETIRFEQESGISFLGFSTLPDTDRPADVFFISSGPHASIELSTTERATFAQFAFYSSASLFDADDELTIRASGQLRSTAQFHSSNTQRLTVQSTNPDDSVEFLAYKQELQMDSTGTTHFIAADDVGLHARKGMEIFASRIAVDENVSTFTMRSTSDDIHMDLANMQITAQNINLGSNKENVVVSSQSALVVNAEDIRFRGTNIHLTFGQVIVINSEDVFMYHGALTIPMRENTVFPGTPCDIENEFVIAHNPFYFFETGSEREFNDDSGVSLCYCLSTWKCRPLSSGKVNYDQF